jgi:hypothetical protein
MRPASRIVSSWSASLPLSRIRKVKSVSAKSTSELRVIQDQSGIRRFRLRFLVRRGFRDSSHPAKCNALSGTLGQATN